MTTATETDVTFEQKVRTEAIKFAREHGYCDSAVNEFLQRIGLPPKQTFKIPVRVPGLIEPVRLRVDDANSDAEARDMLRSDPERTLRTLSRKLHFKVGEFEVPDAPPAPPAGVPAPGQPCPEEGEWYAVSTQSGGPNQCRVRDAEGENPELYCTRPVAHTADWHVAAGKNAGVLATWPAKEGDVRTDGVTAGGFYDGEDYDDDDEEDDDY